MFKVVGIGEALWDVLPAGKQPGGAPCNFAYHAGALGAEASVVSRVGSDDLGRELLGRVADLGIETDGIEIDHTAPTGTVSVTLGADGQPRYTIHEEVAWDHIAGEQRGARRVAEADAVGFGTLAQRGEVSRRTIGILLRSMRPGALRVFDVNLRQHYYSTEIVAGSLALANVLKLSDAELPVLAEMFGLAGDERRQLAELVRRFPLRALACTRGAAGSILYVAGEWSELAASPVAVADTVGAGDSFTAAVTMGLLHGAPAAAIHRRATEVAAHVCAHPGATPPLPKRLRGAFLK